MKFGVRECCDVVLRAKGTQRVGNKIFYKHEPVCYFDTLKTTSLEGASSTSYAVGGQGNTRLMAWEGDRTLTFSMEDALISPVGLMILTGAGLIESSEEHPIVVHTTEQIQLPSTYQASPNDATADIELSYDPYDEGKTATGVQNYSGDYIYVMRLDGNGDITTEPFIASRVGVKKIRIMDRERSDEAGNKWQYHEIGDKLSHTTRHLQAGDVILVDYYREEKSVGGAQEITIEPDKFGGNYYLEASTLFRNEDGIDMPAEFIIPNCKIQSNFTFTMSGTGDPSSFSFTMDAFPDYTRFNPTKKVLAAIQVITSGTGAGNELMRLETNHHGDYVYEDKDGVVRDKRFNAAAAEAATETAGTAEGQLNGVATSARADGSGYTEEELAGQAGQG